MKRTLVYRADGQHGYEAAHCCSPEQEPDIHGEMEESIERVIAGPEKKTGHLR